MRIGSNSCTSLLVQSLESTLKLKYMCILYVRKQLAVISQTLNSKEGLGLDTSYSHQHILILAPWIKSSRRLLLLVQRYCHSHNSTNTLEEWVICVSIEFSRCWMDWIDKWKLLFSSRSLQATTWRMIAVNAWLCKTTRRTNRWGDSCQPWVSVLVINLEQCTIMTRLKVEENDIFPINFPEFFLFNYQCNSRIL